MTEKYKFDDTVMQVGPLFIILQVTKIINLTVQVEKTDHQLKMEEKIKAEDKLKKNLKSISGT